jgi:hypothetical protein
MLQVDHLNIVTTMPHHLNILFRLQVHTSNVAGAGTDAHVFACLFGTKEESGTRELKARGRQLDGHSTHTFLVHCCAI